MKSGKEMVEIFGRCSRLLNKIVLNAEDSFFSRLCAKESDKLLSAFIFFLGCEGEKHGNHAAGNPRIWHANLAQCRLRLISQIKNILNLLDILKHLGLAKPPTSLLLERDLLLLELAVLDVSRPAVISSGKTGKPAKPKTKKAANPLPRLGQTHKEILEFVKSKEQVQNSEVFSRFSHIGRRTIKRKLSELIKLNSVRRFTEGRKVFYAAL